MSNCVKRKIINKVDDLRTTGCETYRNLLFFIVNEAEKMYHINNVNKFDGEVLLIMELERVYATDFYELKFKEEKHFDEFNQLITLAKTINEQQITLAKRINEQQIEAQTLLLRESDRFREMTGMDCVCGFTSVVDDRNVYVVVFETLKSNGMVYDLKYDEEKNRHYVEVEKGVLM